MWQGLVSSSLLITLALWCWEHWLFWPSAILCRQFPFYSPVPTVAPATWSTFQPTEGRRLSKDRPFKEAQPWSCTQHHFPLTSQNSFAQLSPKCKRAWRSCAQLRPSALWIMEEVRLLWVANGPSLPHSPLTPGWGTQGSLLPIRPQARYPRGLSQSTAHTSIHSGCTSLLGPQLLTNLLLGKSTLEDWSFAWEKSSYSLEHLSVLFVALNKGRWEAGN